MLSGCFLVVKHGSKLMVEGGLQRLGQAAATFQFITRQVEDIVVVCLLASTILQRSDVLQVARSLQQKLGIPSILALALQRQFLPSFRDPMRKHMKYACSWGQIGSDSTDFVTKKTGQKGEAILARIEAIIERGQQEEAIQYFQQYQDKLTLSDKEELYLRLKMG
ncbi:hypothetical protein CV093_18145 [Oceanobacillus sp. 143]|nr:hypothetical protein CV093_18145 [Oceanobacillus sp. 143]